ncbi:MAG TPA: type II secretion system protein [Quisquiliibacterium sp.]|nr:type II secretion system protein [Quisquiliibacterium sp.]
MSGRTLPGLGRTGAAGFTLIELVVVIALIGAVGTMGAGLIARAVDMYRNTGARSALVDEAEVAVRRLSRELAGALPNSIRIVNADGGVYLEYVPVLASGRYRAFASVSAEPTGNDPLEFNAVPPDTSFQVLGPPVDVAAGSALVIYNLGIAPADVYAGDNRRAPTVSGTALSTIAFDAAGASFPLDSPERRFFLVGTPVTYFCGPDGRLTRHAGYGWSAAQPTTGGGGLIGATTSRLASSVSACGFELTVGLANLGSVLLRLGLTRNGETVTLLEQVNIDATP